MEEQQAFILIHKLMERASHLNIAFGSSLTMYVDIELAMKCFDIDLEAWLQADDQAFSKDFIGIQQHVNRNTGEFDQNFAPCFARRRSGR